MPKANLSHDISFLKQDGVTEIGLMLARDGGIPIYNEYGDPVLAQQTYSGEATYANLPPDRAIQVGQTDWRAGVGQEIYGKADPLRYWKSFSTDLRFKGMAIAGPKGTTITRTDLPTTVYPDAHPETTSVDGWITPEALAGDSWADLRASAPPERMAAYDDGATAFLNIKSHTAENQWVYLGRIFLLFDVSSFFPVAGGTISIKGGKTDDLNILPDINVYSSNPASDTALITADYQTVGSTPYCDTPITYNNWNIYTYNNFVLNTDGITALNAAIAGDNIFRVSLRNANYDVSGQEPAWSSVATSWFTVRMADHESLEVRPKLVVTY